MLWYTNMAAVGVAVYRSLQKHYRMQLVYTFVCEEPKSDELTLTLQHDHTYYDTLLVLHAFLSFF